MDDFAQLKKDIKLKRLEMTPKELDDEVRKSYVKDIEAELTKACRETIPVSIILSALGNLLIRKCQKEGVNKKHFLKLMSDGWDYHKEEEKVEV